MLVSMPIVGQHFFKGENLLRMVATAVVRLSQRRLPGDPVYDDLVQNAYNHLVLRCLSDGAPPPASVPDMARWAAHVPLGEWPIGLPEEWEASGTFLVDRYTGTPTQACFEWFVSAPDPAAEQLENQLMAAVFTLCRSADAPESYAALRRLMIERPILTGTDLALLAGDLHLSLLHELIKGCYEPAQSSWMRNGAFAECARCHCLLIPLQDGGYRCELDRCHRESHPRGNRMLDRRDRGGVFQLTRPMRMFITGPGLAEAELEQNLAGLGLQPEMWPNYDAYDLRIELPDGEVWAIDVKDRTNPLFLARATQLLPVVPPYDRAFLVVPQYRFDEREAYGRIFNHHLDQSLHGRIELLSDTAFLERVTSALQRITAVGKRTRSAHAHPPKGDRPDA